MKISKKQLENLIKEAVQESLKDFDDFVGAESNPTLTKLTRQFAKILGNHKFRMPENVDPRNYPRIWWTSGSSGPEEDTVEIHIVMKKNKRN